jgi:hypothetical protein
MTYHAADKIILAIRRWGKGKAGKAKATYFGSAILAEPHAKK